MDRKASNTRKKNITVLLRILPGKKTPQKIEHYIECTPSHSKEHGDVYICKLREGVGPYKAHTEFMLQMVDDWEDGPGSGGGGGGSLWDSILEFLGFGSYCERNPGAPGCEAAIIESPEGPLPSIICADGRRYPCIISPDGHSYSCPACPKDSGDSIDR